MAFPDRRRHCATACPLNAQLFAFGDDGAEPPPAARALHCADAADASVHCGLLAHARERQLPMAIHPFSVRVRRPHHVCAPVARRAAAAADGALSDGSAASEPAARGKDARAWNGNLYNSVC